jgi:hypothetical protein
VVAAVAGCGSTKAPSSSAATPGSNATAATGAAPAPTPTPTKAKAGLPVGGKCVLIATSQASSIIGSTPKSSASGVKGGDGIVHNDGCTYIGTPNSLGYDVNDYSGAGGDPRTIVQQALAGMGRAPGAQKFDVPGGDASLGFTAPVGPKTMARIEIAKGSYSISTTGTAPDPTKAKEIALAAAALLLTAVS